MRIQTCAGANTHATIVHARAYTSPQRTCLCPAWAGESTNSVIILLLSRWWLDVLVLRVCRLSVSETPRPHPRDSTACEMLRESRESVERSDTLCPRARDTGHMTHTTGHRTQEQPGRTHVLSIAFRGYSRSRTVQCTKPAHGPGPLSCAERWRQRATARALSEGKRAMFS